MSKITNKIRSHSINAILALLSFSCHEPAGKDKTKLHSKEMQDGKVSITGATINGKKEGLWISYDDRGKVSSFYTYVDDSLSGENINYHDDGETILSRGELKNGKEEGNWVIYYDKNHIAEEGYYQKGIKTGRWKYYTEDGKLNLEIEYIGKLKKVILDNHLLPPTPDQTSVMRTDTVNRAVVVDSIDIMK